MFEIFSYCHKHQLADMTTTSLLAAATLTATDRFDMKKEFSKAEYDKVNEINLQVVMALQLHLKKTLSRTAFAKGRTSLLVNKW